MIRNWKGARAILLVACALVAVDATLWMPTTFFQTEEWKIFWPEYLMFLGIAFFPALFIHPMWRGEEWAVLTLGLIFLIYVPVWLLGSLAVGVIIGPGLAILHFCMAVILILSLFIKRNGN